MKIYKKPFPEFDKNDILIGDKYTATGNCGLSDGIEVVGILTKYDTSVSTLEDHRGQPHTVWTNTLLKIIE